MNNYLQLLERVLKTGKPKADRTGTGTLSLFGTQLRFDLSKGFPLMTTKKIHWNSVARELIWFLNGDTNVKYLQDNGVRIWNEWSDANGNLGPIYGAQWRNWTETTVQPSPLSTIRENESITVTNRVDQIAELIDGLKTNPDSRRHLVSAWNVADLSKMRLPPCHYCFQMYVEDREPAEIENDDDWNATLWDGKGEQPKTPTKKLSCMFQMRSADMFLGVPFNVASYALLTHLVADVCGFAVGELICNMGDTHVYKNHVEQVKTQLARTPGSLPQLAVQNIPGDLRGIKFSDLLLTNYNPQGPIKAPVAV
jgi:thymidylate synthase